MNLGKSILTPPSVIQATLARHMKFVAETLEVRSQIFTNHVLRNTMNAQAYL